VQQREGPVRVAVLNDFPVVVAGVGAMLAAYRDRVEVVERHPGRTVHEPVDVVLYDTFGAPRGVSTELRELAARTPGRLVVYSWERSEERVRQALAAGAAGYVAKATGPEQLVAALERVRSGEVVVPGPPARARRTPDWPGAVEGLTTREAEVVALIVRGMSNQEIADRCYLSINSVKTYVRTAYRKMGVTSRTQAVLWGLRHGFGEGQGATPPGVVVGPRADA
jgi:DNA-binding NarL/FixJ family response regulator